MRLAAVALLLTAVSALAQGPAADAGRLVLDASRALQGGSAARFLGYFDRKQTAGFPALREGVTALLASNKVGSSIEVQTVGERPGQVDLEIDWLLQISSDRDVGPLEQRRETVRATVRVDKDGKAKLIAVQPIAFFAPAPPAP